MAYFGWISLAAAATVVALAAIVRGRLYAIFATVLLGIHTSIAVALAPAFVSVWPVYVYLHAAVYVHFGSLVWARLRPRPYRALVSLPASYFVAGTFLAFPWAIAAALGFEPVGAWVPFAVAAFGLFQSVRHAPEEVDVTLDGSVVAELRRHPHGTGRVDRPLRLVQITDPHLGPFMSERRLRLLAERAVARDPDLVLLTGDFVTMESHAAEEALVRALAPLRALPGRVLACRGNHDHEAPQMVARALEAVGARLLIDEAVVIDTPAGPVDVLGLDFHFRNRAERIAKACARHPRTPDALRLVLLHDPGAFRHVPEGQADLVLSGHTHGGQLGLLSLGLPFTIVSALTSIPDHGLWALGSSRLYVHRGTSHYGFPLRIGVPSEESLLRVHRTIGG
jgi:predicted MPP superfamily phosphohydrolase